ncbi:MAG TPA: hypothetical protein ENG87_01540 [Candidatus Pacearchaeota archaeon]|nr:hypothetical protein [Candidatus Pacearchaeota archaeon]
MKTDWKNLYKIKLASFIPEMDKHDVIKLLLVRKILQKYKRRSWIRIYTEFELENSLRPDIYFENIKDKSVVIYEIQKNYTEEWLKEKTKQYSNYKVPFFNSVDFIPINLNLFSNDIREISKKLEEYVF